MDITHRLKFFKLIRRIVNIGSVSGIRTSNFLGVYSMSKHALKAYSDVLGNKLAQFGVHVSIIEPGNFDSNITKNTLEKVIQRLENTNYLENTRYPDELQTMIQDGTQSGGSRKNFPPPDAVAEAVHHALFADQPKNRYLVTPNQEETDMTLAWALKKVTQLNVKHSHSRSTDELLNMLSKAIEEHG